MITLNLIILANKRLMRRKYPNGEVSHWHIMNEKFNNVAHCNMYFEGIKNTEEADFDTASGKLCEICWPFGYWNDPNE